MLPDGDLIDFTFSMLHKAIKKKDIHPRDKLRFERKQRLLVLQITASIATLRVVFNHKLGPDVTNQIFDKAYGQGPVWLVLTPRVRLLATCHMRTW